MTGDQPDGQQTGYSSAGRLPPAAGARDVSVLFSSPGAGPRADPEEPACFADLNLDQFAGSVTAGREEYDLRPFLCQPLTSTSEVQYRQDVFRDLDQQPLRQTLETFAQRMRGMRECLAQARGMHYQLQRERLFLSAAAIYCTAVESLGREIPKAPARSAAMRAVSDFVTALVAGAAHSALHEDVRDVEDSLAAIIYTLHIKGSRIRISAYDQEADYSAEVRNTFRKFEHSSASGHRHRFPDLLEVDHVEAGILDRLAHVFPAAFGALGSFFERWQHFADPVISRLDREIQFYLAYLGYLEPLRSSGLSFCYPQVSGQPAETSATDAFDLVLAAKLVAEKQPLTCNDVRLAERERLLVVTGPNQGGKTTYARMFGQLHYLASLGCPVPGTVASLVLPDAILTHFERAEEIESLSGKLQADLLRIHEILERATGSSIIILNEIFTSTTLTDALALSARLLEKMAALDCLCLCVTFLDELASFSPATVSMVAEIAADDPGSRTFRLVRRPADGFAYAEAVADKYRLTYDQVRARVTA